MSSCRATNGKPLCALCGKPVDGVAFVSDQNGSNMKLLCHPDDKTKPDCYHLWTVYGKRPEKP